MIGKGKERVIRTMSRYSVVMLNFGITLSREGRGEGASVRLNEARLLESVDLSRSGDVIEVTGERERESDALRVREPTCAAHGRHVGANQFFTKHRVKGTGGSDCPKIALKIFHFEILIFF